MDRTALINELTDLLGARHEARFIVEDVAGDDVRGDISPSTIDAARALAGRRAAGEPLQYLLGHWSFRSLDLLVDGRVLIPRPETEVVVDVALRELARLGSTAPTIVDAGTGTGAIALSMATELSSSHPGGAVWAIDISEDALAVAHQNLERVATSHSDMLPVTYVRGSWLSALPSELHGTIDLVVSNPPYVAAAEWDALSIEVQQEPRGALIADDLPDGTPGLADVVTVLEQSFQWLARPGGVVIELAPHQASAAAAMATSLGFEDVRVEPDLTGRFARTGGAAVMSAIEVIGLHQRDRLRAALLDDGVVVIPHFGGYKLAALLDRGAAVRLLLDIAGPPAEGIVLTCVVGHEQQAIDLASDWDVSAQRLTERMWPGPLTVMVPAAKHVVAVAGDDDEVIRVANASTRSVRTVCDEVGPLLAVELVGVQGGPVMTADDVVARCGIAPVALVVNGRRCDGPGPTVVDCTRTPPLVRRVGMLPESYVDGVMMMAAFERRRWFSSRKSPGIAGS